VKVVEAIGQRLTPRLFALTLRLRENRVEFADDLLASANHPVQEWVNRWCRRRGLTAGYVTMRVEPPTSDPLFAANADVRREFPEMYQWRLVVRWLAIDDALHLTANDLANTFPEGANWRGLGYLTSPAVGEVAA
jgi:hypothetical protein